MELTITTINGVSIAELHADDVVIASVQDALDLMADAGALGAQRLILAKEQVGEAFFDLKSGLAGEILQKFVTYRVALAIVGDFSCYQSASLQAFIMESNRGRHIFFLPTREEARTRLAALA